MKTEVELLTLPGNYYTIRVTKYPKVLFIPIEPEVRFVDNEGHEWGTLSAAVGYCSFTNFKEAEHVYEMTKAYYRL